MDVLFLSVAAGGGHIKAAESIKEVIEERFPGSRTLLVDTFKYINPIVDKVIIGSYLNSIKATPQIYGKLYEMAESGDNLNDFSKTVNKILSFRIKKLIHEYKPSVIVCTHPFPLQMMSNLKKKKKVTTPTVAILTDYATHPFWLHEHIDAYVVAHEYMKYDLISRGFPEEIVHAYGIPVSSNFLQKKNKETLRGELGLDDKLTILLMGGSLGFGEIRDTFLSLLNFDKDLQIIAITGKNKKLKRHLEKYSLNTDKKVMILNYTDRVADFMEVSDFIITKPGGMTVTEALVKELPIFITSPLPGQEGRNAEFLMNNGIAARISDNDNVKGILHQIISNPLRIDHMKQMERYFAKPNSSEDIVNLLAKLAGEV